MPATSDPAYTPGRKDYRSFYVADVVYARFRAALYWQARNPEVVAEFGDSMSVAVERLMETVATDLERRFNQSEEFQMPPATRRRRKQGTPS